MIKAPGLHLMLTVMTYNVGAGLAAPLRLVEVLRQSGADIIGLQELAPEQGAVIADLRAARSRGFLRPRRQPRLHPWPRR